MESVVCSIPADVQQTVDVDQDRSQEANASGDQSQPVATILVNRLPCDKIKILSTMRYSVVARLPKDALRLIFDASTCSLRQSTCRAHGQAIGKLNGQRLCRSAVCFRRGSIRSAQ